MAYMKKHCSSCCSGCNNGYAQVSSTNNSCNRSGCSSCSHHGCGCNHHHGCSSCNSGCSSCGSSNSFGALRSVTGPFSNCGNWWSSDSSFPYYTGPCGPCDPCGQCCCREWPWPWPPMPPVMPVNNGYSSSDRSSCGTGCDKGCNTDCNDGCCNDCGCNHCSSGTGYTSHKNCYCTADSCSDRYAVRQVKPIVDCSNCKRRCDCDD